ncbi:uncharacterized protein LOC133523132 [Cydia pomonella]|uniref:uncharacterized protein LOC133523132 n=1 Tax=Cydia pomonella TaxID=82600 RepID=UPI002ADD65F7|nr:uncharacterized protein LOC133523132 [Cydia pomonella]
MSDKESSHSDMDHEQTKQTPPNFAQKRGKKRLRNSPGTELDKFKEEMRQMMTDLKVTQEKELKKINPNLLEIKTSNAKIESSISFLTAQNEELKKKIDNLEQDRRADKEYINLLEEKIEDMSREARKKNLEIKNVPKLEKETRGDLINMVTKLSQNIGYTIAPTDISDIYRVRSRQSDKPNSPIIVEMVSAIQKTDFLSKCKEHNTVNKTNKLCAKHLGHSSLDTPIYVTEHLTAKAARLRFLARDLARSKSYEFCWTSMGKVFVRKSKTSSIILITNESQIQRLFQES